MELQNFKCVGISIAPNSDNNFGKIAHMRYMRYVALLNFIKNARRQSLPMLLSKMPKLKRLVSGLTD
jgi:hypothetical protein